MIPIDKQSPIAGRRQIIEQSLTQLVVLVQ
jgi:hypothetical protein